MPQLSSNYKQAVFQFFQVSPEEFPHVYSLPIITHVVTLESNKGFSHMAFCCMLVVFIKGKEKAELVIEDRPWSF
jgi:hypothetical protein